MRIDKQLELARLLDRQVSRFCSLEDLVDVLGRLVEHVAVVGGVRNESADNVGAQDGGELASLRDGVPRVATRGRPVPER